MTFTCWEACMKYEIYLEYTRFIFTDLDHPKLISEWCKNLNYAFIVTIYLVWSMSVNHVWNGKPKEMLLAKTMIKDLFLSFYTGLCRSLDVVRGAASIPI